MKRIAVIVFICTIIPVSVLAYEIPEISGYDMFTSTAQEISTGSF